METSSPPTTCPKTVTVRRNPQRKARPTPYTSAAIQNPSPSTNRPQISSFPIDEILSIEIPQNSQHDSSSATSSSSSSSEKLKVFLRIKPLISPKIGDQNSRSLKAKNVWPQNPLKKNAVKDKNVKSKRNEECITVNDPNSVTLSPPLALQTSKRIKSEVYQGFSYVFPAKSSQAEVYEKMVSPLVEDILKGKSGMLAALGPSGSGKTHTIFGTPREPGMVPIALKRIFRGTTKSCSESSRSFYLSIFEICSERGKAEKMLDLLLDGADLCIQQSTIKGLQEISISDAAQAESLIARAMLKRATAMTNANSQSSRSQCIINVRCVVNKLDREDNFHANDAVLTIVDLAGAEREKRTGNHGARLLESNFINNTSMVFGLCLRSLLEHQKNPKKPLQKHFQNSLLTRYLRDYLEGRKRMTLILTVKSGEEEYLDTSYLLRQASPYMKIKFDNVEDSSNLVCNKRQLHTLSRIEHLKRVKLSGPEAGSAEEGKGTEEKHQLSKEEEKLGIQNHALLDFDPIDLVKKERNHHITQKFAKALWNVLKQYNEKLKVAENEIQSLTEKMRVEKTRNLQLEKELKDLKSGCTYSGQSSVEGTLAKEDTNLGSGIALEAHKTREIVEINVGVDSLNCEIPECNSTPKTCDSTPRKDQDGLSQFNVDIHSLNCEASECNGTSKTDNSTMRNDQDVISQINLDVHSPSFMTSECDKISKQFDSSSREQDAFSQATCSKVEVVDTSFPSAENSTDQNCQDWSESNTVAVQCRNQTAENNPSNADTADFDVSTSQSPVMVSTNTSSSAKFSQLQSGEEEESPSSIKVSSTRECDIGCVPNSEPNLDTFNKPLNMEKPRRRLMPSSTILLRDISTLDVEDEIEKPKGNRCGKILPVNEGKRTQGSISLLRLLKNNLNI